MSNRDVDVLRRQIEGSFLGVGLGTMFGSLVGFFCDHFWPELFLFGFLIFYVGVVLWIRGPLEGGDE